jgi:pimeloyl-ACP methyl ester carboxylesterase
LLGNAGVQEPYVLVGHSLGGTNMQLYASRYPDEVAGVVLVDSALEDLDLLYN